MSTPLDDSHAPSVRLSPVRRLHAWIGRHIVGFRLLQIAAGPGSALKILFATLTMPVKRRSPWRNKPYRVAVKLDGKVVQLNLSGPTDFLVLREIVLEREYQLPDGFNPRTVVDLGAHIGLASLFFSVVLGDPKVVALEADPALVTQTKANTSGHNVTVLNAAIASESGKRSFFTSDESWANSFERTLPQQQEIEIEALSLADVLDRAGLERVDLMKIDVEGAEWGLLTDPAFTARADAIVGELHGVDGHHPHELVEALERDFDVTVLREDDEAAIFQAFRRK